MKADLHLHSSASDGTDSPADLIDKVDFAKLDGVALMDHDTLGGIDEARQAADDLGIALIPGTELSVEHPLTNGSTVKLHMLAYGIEPRNGPLQDKLEWLLEGRNARNPKIIEKLRGLGYAITMDEVEEKAQGKSVGRPHIADVLVAKGHFSDRNDVFEGILNDGGTAYVERDRLSAAEAIGLATASGGVTVIAHPLTMGVAREDLDDAIDSLISYGLAGIEAHHPMHDVALRDWYSDFARNRGLIATGGSDYHGTGKKGYSVGIGTGDLRIPDDAFETIQEAIADIRLRS